MNQMRSADHLNDETGMRTGQGREGDIREGKRLPSSEAAKEASRVGNGGKDGKQDFRGRGEGENLPKCAKKRPGKL